MILWYLFIALEVWRNYFLIEKKKQKPIYLQSFILRGMAAILTGIVVLENRGINDVIHLNAWQLLLVWWPIISHQVASFFVFFSPALNIVRGKNWYYLGQESGWLDSLPPMLYWLLYGMCLTFLIL